jgi:hypothetical protein
MFSRVLGTYFSVTKLNDSSHYSRLLDPRRTADVTKMTVSQPDLPDAQRCLDLDL